jgi:voltage-gated potassium channel Kch
MAPTRHVVFVIVGNAARPDALNTANLALAKCVIFAIPEALEAGQIVREEGISPRSGSI